VETDAQGEVGVGALDRGAAAEPLALGVDQPVLDLESDPARVADGRARGGRGDREAAVRVQQLVPERAGAAVERLVVARGPAAELEQDAIGRARSPVGADAVDDAAREADTADVAPLDRDAQCRQLPFEDLLEAARAGRDPAQGGGGQRGSRSAAIRR
jgi:hypothetical protein